METVEAYLARKREELELLNSSLRDPLTIRFPRSVAEVIEQKFHLASALKAEHALHDWAQTETAWTHSGRPRSGPFEFKYDYQRADLEVTGPSFYALENLPSRSRTVYTASGMAAISALLMATAPVFSEADIVTMPNSYGETTELIDGHATHLRRVELGATLAEITKFSGSGPRILVLDSCTTAGAFEAILKCAQLRLDLILFDTTCFSSGSGRILRALSWARSAATPIILLRSHTKLDSLGVEYGRLGSVVSAPCPRAEDAKQQLLETLMTETRNAVRLFGGAALPAHFPPYVGSPAYRSLTNKRVAAMLLNSRRMAHCISAQLPGLAAELHFAHGLYVTLASAKALDENQAREIVAELCADLRRRGLPLRHAGSFGFDFGAAEWSKDRIRDRYVVRIAAADLPTSLWGEIVAAVGAWWKARERRVGRRPQNAGTVTEVTL
ncbi:hypothetical protein JQ629_35220 [Bradyrhizobium sp. AUGA SZCCT0222]|uniref:hypothetical protein n=1 Tax=Bradyrhizobium sp. AUGA SZCCT0222 TaxID=2807668 RepID=UPI001BAC121D|nr:hypothetical protein [Bradyrhizobium sp. AUGA SZCCT0222]MBR1272742.1 hypothetical protein [Bradyrhizobium sp. AUGA SZCCT0222]